MQRRTLIAGTGLALLALTVTGCGGGSDTPSGSESDWSLPSEDPTTTIQVLGQHPKDSGILEVFEAFEKAHPTIKVEFESVPFDQLNSVLDARIGNKDGNPDVYWADQPRIAALSARGYTEPLSRVFEDELGPLDEAPIESSSFDGELWALPIANSTQLMYYNKTLLDQAGLESPSADPAQRVTWEELTSNAKKAVDAGAGQGLMFGQTDRYYQLEALSSSLGGSVGAKGEGNLEPDFTSDAWIEAMTWYGSIFEDGISSRGVKPEQADDEFLAGNVAYFVQGPWFLPTLNGSDIDWGVAPHPYFESGEPVTATGSWSLAMSPFSDDKEAAAIFMKWMSIDDGGGYSTHMPEPELPANSEGKEQYYEREVFASEAGQDAAAIIDYETQNTAVPRVPTVGYVEFEEILGRAYSDIRNGSDPAGALQAASDELEAAWAKYK